MKVNQRTSNPFPNSDSNKRYYTYDYYLRKVFGGKCAKIPLDGGFTCPNIDGRCGLGGCIYCSGRGSGDFAAPASLSIAEQFALIRIKMGQKWSTQRCIAYFQAHTGTYAPVEVLRPLYEEALAQEGVMALHIATRADCLPEDVLALLCDMARKTHLVVELGLQSADDDTARRINRGHSFADFTDGVSRLRRAAEAAEVQIEICIHLILGLPGEDEARMMDSVEKVAALQPEQVKIHLLHVLRGTALAGMYERGEYEPLGMEEYVDLVVKALERLPEETVIARLTGDGMGEDLLAPEWSRRKVAVLDAIDRALYVRQTAQGVRFAGANERTPK